MGGIRQSLRVFILITSCLLTANAQVVTQDSLALVALYNATGGNNWINNTNWLQAGKNVSTWYGVTVTLDGTRVESLALHNNNLTGQIPAEIGDLYELIFLSMESNHLSGAIPPSINNIDKLLYLFLGDNDYTGEIPAFLFQPPPPDEGGYIREVYLENNDFTGVSHWTAKFENINAIGINDNNLDFEDLEPFMDETIPWFYYDPQRAIYSADEITVREGAVLTLKTATGGSANHYQWRKEGGAIPAATQANYTRNIVLGDEGEYTAWVTSDVVPDLTLERNPITLHVKEDTVYRSCDGSAVTLNAVVSDPQATYQWSNGATASSTVVNASGKYGVRIETANYVLSDTLEVLIPVNLSLGPDRDSCEPSVSLSSNIADADTFQWQTPEGTINNQNTITASVNGSYILEITQGECVQKDTLNVILNHFTTGDYTITAGNAPVEHNGVTLTDVTLAFTNTTGTGENFAWSFGDGEISSVEVPVHAYGKAGQYTVMLIGSDSRGCPITVEKTINVVDLVITNAISPNGDGKNDKLYVEPFLYNAELKIVDRSGRQVFETTSYNDDFSGSGLESGVYYYELHFKEIDKSYKGFVHIMK